MIDQSQWIRAQRPAKTPVSADLAYGVFIDEERDPDGALRPYLIVLLSNRECPFTCLMCDLWKNTLDSTSRPEDIITQIDRALAANPQARGIKIYNAGSMFDVRAVPESALEIVADRIAGLGPVIVESHPAFIGASAKAFNEKLGGTLQVAIGLETVHEPTLASLNKQMTLDDFDHGVTYLHDRGIASRAFILVRPPGQSEIEGVEWALRSLEHAARLKIECAVLIPTRLGNGALDVLARAGKFEQPRLISLETVLRVGLESYPGRVFADLWDLETFVRCAACDPVRINNLREMNRTGRPVPPTPCYQCLTP